MTGREDRQDISDALNRFAAGIDRRDCALFRTAFTDDCQVQMGDYDDDLVRTVGGWRIERRTFTQVRITVSSA